MRRQSGYEDDWINVLNGVTNLANTLQRTKATGLQIQGAEDERDRLDRERKGESWGYDYEQLNKGLSGAERVAPENFTRSGDTNIGLPEKTRGLASAVTTQNMVDDAYIQKRQNEIKSKTDQYITEFSKMTQDELSRMDTAKYGQDAYPARLAQGKVLANIGEVQGNRNIAMKNRAAVAQQKFDLFSGSIKEADRLLRAGDKNGAAQIMARAINEENNDARKAKITENGLKLYITYDGEDKYDEKDLSHEQALEKLKSISKQDYFRQFIMAAEDARIQNVETLDNPIVMSDGRDLYQVIKTSDPLSSKFTHEAYSLTTGQKLPYSTMAEMRQNGLYNAKIPGADGRGTDKNLDVKGLQFAEEQDKNAFIVDARNKNLPLSINPETGAIEAMQPLTETQRLEANTLAGNHGINIGWDKGEAGSLWWKDEVYTPGAYSYRPGARGLQIETDLSDVGTQSKKRLDDETAQTPRATSQSEIVPQSFVGYADAKYSGKMDPAYKQKIAELIYSGGEKPEGLPESDWNAVKEELIYLGRLLKPSPKPSAARGLTLSDDYLKKRNTYNIANGL